MNEESLNPQFTRVCGDNESATNESNDLRIKFVEEEIHNSEVVAGACIAGRIEEDTIDTMSKSLLLFSNRDQIKDDKLLRL